MIIYVIWDMGEILNIVLNIRYDYYFFDIYLEVVLWKNVKEMFEKVK